MKRDIVKHRIHVGYASFVKAEILMPYSSYDSLKGPIVCICFALQSWIPFSLAIAKAIRHKHTAN